MCEKDTFAQNFPREAYARCPIAFMLLRVTLNSLGEPTGRQALYCNEALRRLADIPANAQPEQCFMELFPDCASETLHRYYEAAYLKKSSEFEAVSRQKGMYLQFTVYYAGQEGYCCCLLRDIRTMTLEHDRQNWVLSEALEAVHREKQFLDRMCMDYTAIYCIDLDSDAFEVIRLISKANAWERMDEHNPERLTFAQLTAWYSERFVLSMPPARFNSMLSGENLRRLLRSQERVTFRYETRPDPEGRRYFEGQAIRFQWDESCHVALLGFRYIDDIVTQEQAQQLSLRKAVDSLRLSNEIVSAISKIYYSIYRINLRDDFYEEVSAEGEMQRLTGKTGVASAKLAELCEFFAAPEYQNAVMKFFDLETLPHRLSEDDTVAIEYMAKDKNWHLARFIAKKRNDLEVVTHVLYVTRVISDTKRREQNLIVQAETAKQESQSKTVFLSRMAHDIRTPLNAIRGYAEIAKKHAEDPALVRRDLEKIDLSSGYLQQIIDDALDLGRIEKGKMQIYLQTVDIPALFRECGETAQGIAPQKGLHFSLELEELLSPGVLSDGLRLRQIFNNLLSNAVKYTPAGGTVTFRMSETPLPDGNLALVTTIADTGIGMTPEFMAQMYHPFSRAVDTRVNQVRGSGLGLSVVKNLVELMNGEIHVESAPGVGTTFQVTIPCKKAALEAKAPAEENQDLFACEGMRLLVAEDNDLNFAVVQELLAMYGVTCDRAEDGAESVERVRNAPDGSYDAILMDMQMPVMDGLEATRRIRGLDSTWAKTVPILALTANAFRQDVDACLEAGMNAHLSKPINIRILLKTLEGYKTK